MSEEIKKKYVIQLSESGLMDTVELAKFLKFSPRHVANLVQRRKIPRLKIGRAVRFNPYSVIRALESYEEQEITL